MIIGIVITAIGSIIVIRSVVGALELYGDMVADLDVWLFSAPDDDIHPPIEDEEPAFFDVVSARTLNELRSPKYVMGVEWEDIPLNLRDDLYDAMFNRDTGRWVDTLLKISNIRKSKDTGDDPPLA